MSVSFRDRNPFIIGIASILAIVLAVAGAFSVGAFHIFEHTFAITGQFSDAAGVTKGAPVRLAGVQVGRVTSVRPDRSNGRVIVRMVINRGVELGPKTRAEIALATLLGAKYVRLSGKVAEPFLHKGSVIPNDRTSTPYDVFELTKVATNRIEATDNEKLNTLIKQLAVVTDGKEETLRELIHGIARLSTAVASRDEQLGQLVDRADTVSNTLAVKDQTLAALLDQSDGILRVLASRHDLLARGIGDAAKAFGQLAGVVAAHKTELDAILDTLHPTLDIIDRHEADLDRSLAWIGEGAYGLSLAPSHGSWADVYVRAIGPDVIGLLGALAGGGAP